MDRIFRERNKMEEESKKRRSQETKKKIGGARELTSCNTM